MRGLCVDIQIQLLRVKGDPAGFPVSATDIVRRGTPHSLAACLQSDFAVRLHLGIGTVCAGASQAEFNPLRT